MADEKKKPPKPEPSTALRRTGAAWLEAKPKTDDELAHARARNFDVAGEFSEGEFDWFFQP